LLSTGQTAFTQQDVDTCKLIRHCVKNIGLETKSLAFIWTYTLFWRLSWNKFNS